MKKPIIATAIIIIFAVTAAVFCHGENGYGDEDLRVFEGKVVSVDTGKGIIVVNGTIDIAFPISYDTKLQKDGYDIKLVDINAGDYVTVQYYRRGSSSRVPLKVLAVTVEYRGS